MEVVNVSGAAPEQGYNADALWLVGCGNMAGAMVEGWQAAGSDLSQAVAVRPSGKPVGGVRTVQNIGQAGEAPGIVLLGFKPQKLDEVVPELAPVISKSTIVLSLLAGVEVESLRARFPRAAAVVRVMPNITVAIRRGVVAIYGEPLDEGRRNRIASLLSPLGYVAWCATEAELGAIGQIAGSGPAYVARFTAALATAGEARGLDPGLALTIARETILGTGWLAAATGEPMDEIARKVASPNGTTQAGLAVLDAGLPGLVDQTIEAATSRSAELAAEGRAIDSTPPRP